MPKVIRPTGLEAMLKSIAHTLVSQYTVTITRPITAVKSTQMETAKDGKVLLTPWMR